VGLLAGALTATALMMFLSCLLAWHALRRVLDIPRLPRPRGMYWALGLAWGALAVASTATAVAALLLRDHQRLDGRTEVGELRCEPTVNGRARVELRTAGSPLSAMPLRYDVDGQTCVVSVKEVELRPALRALGLGALARIDAVGSAAIPTTNPSWLTPAPAGRAGLLGLVVQRTHAVQIAVPADPKQRFVVVAAPGEDPSLQPI
jgi:hypothetical protein